MKIIKDIRTFSSKIENIEGNSLPSDYGTKFLKAKIMRIVMGLRENNFSLGDYDHLYINFTTCNVINSIALAKRKIDIHNSWYRFYDVHVADDMFNNLDEKFIIETIKHILKENSCSKEFSKEELDSLIADILEKKDLFEVKYKEKVNSKRKAIIYLRYSDNCLFIPIIKIFDLENKLIFEKELSETNSLDDFGTLIVTNEKVVIKPKKSSWNRNKEDYIINT